MADKYELLIILSRNKCIVYNTKEYIYLIIGMKKVTKGNKGTSIMQKATFTISVGTTSLTRTINSEFQSSYYKIYSACA